MRSCEAEIAFFTVREILTVTDGAARSAGVLGLRLPWTGGPETASSIICQLSFGRSGAARPQAKVDREANQDGGFTVTRLSVPGCSGFKSFPQRRISYAFHTADR